MVWRRARKWTPSSGMRILRPTRWVIIITATTIPATTTITTIMNITMITMITMIIMIIMTTVMAEISTTARDRHARTLRVSASPG